MILIIMWQAKVPLTNSSDAKASEEISVGDVTAAF